MASSLQGANAWIRSRFELRRRGEGENLASMEGLRGLAVFLVFVVHYLDHMHPFMQAGSLLSRLLVFLTPIGHTGVDLFFVLSGYLIYGSLITRPRPFLPYMARRIQRIFPAFLAVFFVYLVLSLSVPSRSKLPAGILEAGRYLFANLLLLPGLLPIPAMITVAWSLSYEMFYYLAIPMVIGALRLREWSSPQRMSLFVLLGIVLVVYCAILGGHVRLVMFIAGILLYEVGMRESIGRLGSYAIVSCLLLCLSYVVLRPSGSASHAMQALFLCAGYGALCHGCFVRPSGSLPRLFRWTPLRWLGNMSYSYYLIHGLTLQALALLLHRAGVPAVASPSGLALFGGAFAFSLLVAAGLFLAVERPLSLRISPPSASVERKSGLAA